MARGIRPVRANQVTDAEARQLTEAAKSLQALFGVGAKVTISIRRRVPKRGANAWQNYILSNDDTAEAVEALQLGETQAEYRPS